VVLSPAITRRRAATKSSARQAIRLTTVAIAM